jgi:hypothetical protein
MLDDLQPLPDTPAPAPGDAVTMLPGTLADPAATTLIVADVPEGLDGALLLYLPDDHPRYWDWAALADPADVRTVTRYDQAGIRTWTLPTP